MSYLIWLFLFTIISFVCSGQTDSSNEISSKTYKKYLNTINSKAVLYSSRITNKTEKTIAKLAKWEKKINQLLSKQNPEVASKLFGSKTLTFESFYQQIKNSNAIYENSVLKINEYNRKINKSIKYLDIKSSLIDSANVQNVKNNLKKLNELDSVLNNQEKLSQFIKERKKVLLKEATKFLGNNKNLLKINKEVYYYNETLKNYKDLFENQDKTEKYVISLLEKNPAFKEFLRNNKLSNSLIPGSDNLNLETLVGLQTKSTINKLIQNKISSAGSQGKEIISQNLKAAMSDLENYKKKILQNDQNPDSELPPSFKPNRQKSKTFLQRLEYGVNFQLIKVKSYLPGSADFGFNLGYKINDKSTMGLGIAYKLSVGSIDKINFKHEGLSFRSYLDWKLKKRLYLSGGFEKNYNASFKKFSDLKYVTWTSSGLLGLTKILSKGSKKMKLQFSYDLLHSTHIPNTSPFIYRIGYNFN